MTYASVSVVLIVLRYRRPAQERPWRVPLNLGHLPLPTLLAIVLNLLLATRLGVQVGLFGLAVGVAGAIFCVVHSRRRAVPTG